MGAITLQSLTKLFKFLTKLWGILAVSAILFPGAAILLKLPLATENSELAFLYPVLPIIISSFCLLYLTTYLNELSVQKTARKISIIGFILSIILFFSFLFIRVEYLNVEVVKEYYNEKSSYVYFEKRSKGLIFVERRSKDDKEFNYEYGDPVDIIALLCISLTFSCLTIAFGSLGIFSFMEAKRIENEVGISKTCKSKCRKFFSFFSKK